MENFDKVIVKTVCEDIVINDGKNLEIDTASYYVKDNCLYIDAFEDDVVITLPAKTYELIDITTESGDCLIEFKEAGIVDLNFRSESGDLTLDAICLNVSFESESGDYVRTKGSPDKQIVRRSKPLTVKTTSGATIKTETSAWRNGERYK